MNLDLTLTESEFMLVWEALDQYAQNSEDADEPDVERVRLAEDLRDRMGSRYTRLAEMGEERSGR